VSPLADAGVPLKALQWMFQEHGPLRFKPEFDLRQWRWLASLPRQLPRRRQPQHHRQAAGTGRTVAPGMAQLEPACRWTNSWRDAGKLVVYRSRKAFDAAAAKADSAKVWTRPNARRASRRWPRRGKLAGGIYNSGEAVADCHAFCLALAERIAAHPRFQGLCMAKRPLVTVRRAVTGLETSAGLLRADAYVLAAGIRAAPGADGRHLSAAVSAQGLQPDRADPPGRRRARDQRDRLRAQGAVRAHRRQAAGGGDGRHGRRRPEPRPRSASTA
jgi:D-amino-acid dehydrogenase